MCASRLAETLEMRRQLSASERELRIALRNESDPMGRALLLIQMLRVQLANRNDKGAEKTFPEVRDIAAQNRLHSVTVDIHVMIGDYCWLQSHRSRLNALKAYIMAMLEALQIDFDAYGNLLAHFITFVTRPKAVPAEVSFARLAKHLEKWVTKDITNDPGRRSVVMRPITLLKRLLPFTGDRKKLANELNRWAKSGELLPFDKQ